MIILAYTIGRSVVISSPRKSDVVGIVEGVAVGNAVGFFIGALVGDVGLLLGDLVGDVGTRLGTLVGVFVQGNTAPLSNVGTLPRQMS